MASRPPSAEQLLPGHPSSLAVWGEADSSTLICRQVQDITHDVKTFLFESAQPSLFQHEPGQFVTLQLQIDGRSVSRCYTISSPPTRPISWVSPSNASLEALCRTGCTTRWSRKAHLGRRPFGVFTIARHQSAKYLFLSGGSGITPVMSMTRTCMTSVPTPTSCSCTVHGHRRTSSSAVSSR